MPPLLARIADFTHLSAAMEALWATWQGHAPPLFALTILGVPTLLFGVVAAQMFHWE